MNIVKLKLEGALRFSLDCRGLQPERLSAMKTDDIRAIRFDYGRKKISLGDIFELTSVPTDDEGGELQIDAATNQLRFLGADMTQGRMIIKGDVGDYLGLNLSGGDIIVNGNASNYAASGQRGGSIHVKGNVGNFAGGAAASAMQGLRGGTLVISGTAGDQLGFKMRRGIIVAQGAVGNFCAGNMIAGTIVLGDQVGTQLGLGMRRGTVIALATKPVLEPTFNLCGNFSLPIITILRHHLHSINHHAALRLAKIRRVVRYCGDLGYDGQGEVLIAEY